MPLDNCQILRLYIRWISGVMNYVFPLVDFVLNVINDPVEQRLNLDVVLTRPPPGR